VVTKKPAGVVFLTSRVWVVASPVCRVWATPAGKAAKKNAVSGEPDTESVGLVRETAPLVT